MAAAQLRKAFRYPGDDDNNNEHETTVEDLDEQEQEQFIAKLQHENTAHDALYSKLFLALPLLATLPFLGLIVSSTSRATARLAALVAVASLLATAYLLPDGPARGARATTGSGSGSGSGSDAVYLLILSVQRTMASVDVSRQLSDLRYGYKGA
ncbi:MAG: hypothetical protein M1826_002807 [Phylliscum demangeonii]|nr:MAG: hypothetical protein M1826_002807 [Phylliscum demangeonii]